jgi:hypothetical protein
VVPGTATLESDAEMLMIAPRARRRYMALWEGSVSRWCEATSWVSSIGLMRDVTT